MAYYPNDDQIFAHFWECYDTALMEGVCQYVADRVGGLTDEFTQIVGDVLASCLFMSGDVSLSGNMLQFMINVGSFYRGDMAKKVYEYVMSFNALPFSVFPDTYEGFKNEAAKHGIELFDE